jgi:hypothetical protein
MWKWFNCYLSGRHSFGVSCEPGAIFLKCSQCGRRSPGWAVDQNGHLPAPAPPFRAQRATAKALSPSAATPKHRALPIGAVAAG